MSAEPTTTQPLSAERLPTDDGWRVTTRCNQCGMEMHLETPDTMVDEETGEEVEIGEPNAMALRIAAFAMVCDGCDVFIRDREERSQTDRARRMRTDASKLPPDLKDLGFAAMKGGRDRDRALVAALEWAEARNPRGLLFYGEVGVGKTRLAATAVNKRLDHAPIMWVSVPVLLAQIGASFGDEGRAAAVSVLTGKGALALDDLDKLNPSEWALSHLFTAIDSRVTAGAPLIVTTNLSPNRIADKLGEPIASRLVGYCGVHELGGHDRRVEPMEIPL